MEGEGLENAVVDQAAQTLLGDPSIYWCSAQGPTCPVGGSPPLVNVCWEPSSFNNSAFNNVRTWVEDGIRSSWVRYSRLNLANLAGASGWGICSPGQASIHVNVLHSNDPTKCGGVSQVGTNGNGVTNGTNVPDCDPASACGLGAASSQEVCVKRVSMHEFGHAIGFWHEEQRDPSGTSAVSSSTISSTAA
jgi:hypothetical protein